MDNPAAVAGALHQAVAVAVENPEQITLEFLQEMLPLVAHLYHDVLKIQRELDDERSRNRAERAAFVDEMRLELLDREANTARTLDRFEVIRDRNAVAGKRDATSFESGVNSIALLNKLYRSLCPLDSMVCRGTEVLRKQVARK